MTNPLQVGIDNGGTKMLTIATTTEIQARSQISTGKNFTTADAQSAIERFIQTLAASPDSIGIAIPGLVSGSP